MFPKNARRVTNVTVRPLLPAAPDNPRGRRTFEIRPWESSDGKQKKDVSFDNPQITYYYREPGEVCGGHCHRGDNAGDPDRNPEQIVFVLGSVDIDLEDLWGGQHTLRVEAGKGKPVLVTIPPWVLHTFRVGEQGVHFFETKRNPYSRDTSLQDVCLEGEFRRMKNVLRSDR